MELDPNIRNGLNYEAWKLPKYNSSNFQKLPNLDQMKYLACLGHLAASSHNTQPWRFQLLPEQQLINVYLDLGTYNLENGKAKDLRRVLSVSDKYGRQGCVSIGCAIANIETAAKFLGVFDSTNIIEIPKEKVRPIQQPSSEKKDLVHAAIIKLGKTKSSADSNLYEAIFTRMVNRSEYDQKRIPDEVLQKIHKIKGENINIEVIERNPTTAAKLMLLANSQLQADKTVFNDDGFITELAKWVLKNGSKNGLGMPFETFGVKSNFDALKLYLSFQAKKAFSIKDKAGFSQGAMKGIESAPIVGIISVSKDEPKAWVEAGRGLGKIALIAETSRLAMAIHAGIAEVEGIKQSLSWINHQKDTVVTVFRIGYPTVIMPHAPRLPLEQVIF